MILSQISYLDCIAFLILLTPQLLIHVGFFTTAACGLKALPYLVLQMPYQLIRERYFMKDGDKTPFVRHATLFQDIVIRCVRYAFADIPASIGKVFFSKPVALPFFWFRMFRHGIFKSRIPWQEINQPAFTGLWMVCDPDKQPDIVIYYCHGGGFSMGSSYFYIEFLLAWVSLLRDAGYKNPACFALEYTLVPTAVYPQQIHETLAGYEFVLSKVDDSSRICVSGDSAGATLQLSLMLFMSKEPKLRYQMPGMGIMISPWATIISPHNKNTPSDYLNADSLHLYGSQYIGTKVSVDDPVASPGFCRDITWWRDASPTRGWLFVYGAEEVFAPECKSLIAFLKKAGAEVSVHEEPGWIHAWPVVKLFLCDEQSERQSGLRSIVSTIRKNIE